MNINQINNENNNGIYSGVGIVGDNSRMNMPTSKAEADRLSQEKITPADYLRQVTYSKKNKGEATVEDIQAQAQMLDAVQMKNEMVTGTNTTTSKDLEEVENEGFSLRNTDIHTVVTVTDKIQAKLAKAGVDTSYFNDDLTKEQLEEIGVNQAAMQQYQRDLVANDVPLTDENIKEFELSINQLTSIDSLNSGAIKYLLANNLEPTVANIYSAVHNGVSTYVSEPDSELMADASMKDAISTVVAGAGMEVNDDNIARGQWLSVNDISVTAENLKYYDRLNNLKLPFDAAEISKITRNMAESVAEGDRPGDAAVINEYTNKDIAQSAVDVINQTTDEDLAYLIEKGLEINVANLRESHNLMSSGTESAKLNGDYTESGLSIIKARRSLEEVRLVMTAESNMKLQKQGINIDTKPIESLVEDLKNIENDYYKNLLASSESGESDGTSFAAKLDESAKLFSNVIDIAESLKQVPAYAIGRLESTDTVQAFHDKANALKLAMDKAGERYETMQTEVRKDLGDSIKKAFANVDDILDDLGLAQTANNQRAVRILAYNRQEITASTITAMKQADLQVQKAFDSLKPATVREMIKDGVNPLNMNLDELNKKASEISERIGAANQEEKYSEYLYKLDMRGQISEEEREAYIGIYRLIHQVEASDGAAVGALVTQGADLTMGNLLSAVRSYKKGQMDYKVDDDFAGVNAVNKGTSITEQINVAYQMECFTEIQSKADSPEQFEDFFKGGQENNWQSMTPEEFLNQMQSKQADEKASEAYYTDVLEDMAACARADEEVYRLLDQRDIPATIDNVMAMQHMMMNPNHAVRKLFNMEKDYSSDDIDLMEELKKIKAEIYEKFGEDVEAPEEYAKALDTLYEVAEHCMQTVMYDKGMTSLDLKQLQMASKQLMIGAKAARDEHYMIPVETENGTSIMNVKVVRGTEENGMVRLSMQSDTLGNISAMLHAKKNGVDGFLATDSREAYEKLLAMSDEINEKLGGDVNINFQPGMDRNSIFNSVPSANSGAETDTNGNTYKVQTSRLYGLAKNLMELLRVG